MTNRTYRHRLYAILLAAALLLIGTTAGVAVGAAYLYPASAGNPTVQSGCVIRFDERTSSGLTRPRVHANSAHYCVGVTDVYAEYPSGDVVIKQQTVGPVVYISVSPDETLAARGITCGASGGVGVLRLRCYDRAGRVKAYSPKMYGSTSNLWVGWTSWDS